MRSRKRKGAEQAEPAEASTTSPSPGGDERRLLPVDIQQKEFRLAFRGYNEHDVDEFLDQVTEELARLHEENKRLSERSSEAGAGPYGGAAPGALIEDAQRRAEEIVREAREQAAAVLSNAGSAAAEGPVPTDQRASRGEVQGDVRPFLSREREFLQGLAGLIQQHAEAVKQDAQRLRGAAPSPAESGADAEASDRPTLMAEAEPEPAPASSATPQPESGDAWRTEPPSADAWAEPSATRLEPSVDAGELSPVEPAAPPDRGSGASDATAAWDAPAPPWSEPSAPAREQSWSSPSATEERATGPEPEPEGAGRVPSAAQPAASPLSAEPPAGGTGEDAGRPGDSRSALGARPTAVPPHAPAPAPIPFPSTPPSSPSPSAPVPPRRESFERGPEAAPEQPTLIEPSAPDGRDEDDRSLRELFWGEE